VSPRGEISLRRPRLDNPWRLPCLRLWNSCRSADLQLQISAQATAPACRNFDLNSSRLGPKKWVGTMADAKTDAVVLLSRIGVSSTCKLWPGLRMAGPAKDRDEKENEVEMKMKMKIRNPGRRPLRISRCRSKQYSTVNGRRRRLARLLAPRYEGIYFRGSIGLAGCDSPERESS
jgi:hypothetical protein